MKLLALILLLLASTVGARTLHAEPSSIEGGVPTGADFNVNGGPWQPCNLDGQTWKVTCSLEGITTPGYYVLRARYTNADGEGVSNPYNYIINEAGMSIVSSFTKDEHPQADGSFYVIETHTDTQGRVYRVGPYLAPSTLDVPARVAASAVALTWDLAEAEAEAKWR